MNAIFKTFYCLLMAAVLSLGALLVAPTLPITGNIQIKIVKSGSMEPAIKTGSIIVDRPAAAYKVGDVVTFGEDTKTQIPTTHRILAIDGEGPSAMLTTKGDANNAPDPSQTPTKAVHGKVLLTVPYLGYILSFAREPLGFTLLIGVPAALIIIDECLAIWHEVLNVRARRRALRRVKEAPGRPPVLRVPPRERAATYVLDLRRQSQ